MIAYLEHFLNDNDSEPILQQPMNLEGTINYTSIAFAGKDFGGLHASTPFAVVKPSGSHDITTVIRFAYQSPNLTVAARGNDHSINGQAMANNRLVIDMKKSIDDVIDVVCCHDGGYAVDIVGGALWEDVLKCCVLKFGLSLRSWTDYLGLTVDGALSNAGVSGQTFRYGPQTSNVTELEVVTGKSISNATSKTTKTPKTHSNATTKTPNFLQFWNSDTQKMEGQFHPSTHRPGFSELHSFSQVARARIVLFPESDFCIPPPLRERRY